MLVVTGTQSYRFGDVSTPFEIKFVVWVFFFFLSLCLKPFPRHEDRSKLYIFGGMGTMV